MKNYSKESIIFDTSAILRFSDYKSGAKEVGKFLEDSINHKINASISSMSVFEIVMIVGRKDLKKALSVIEFLKKSNVKIISAEEKTCSYAAMLKLKYPDTSISTADAIIIQTGIEQNARIITGDKAWREIEEANVKVV